MQLHNWSISSKLVRFINCKTYFEIGVNENEKAIKNIFFIKTDQYRNDNIFIKSYNNQIENDYLHS